MGSSTHSKPGWIATGLLFLMPVGVVSTQPRQNVPQEFVLREDMERQAREALMEIASLIRAADAAALEPVATAPGSSASLRIADEDGEVSIAVMEDPISPFPNWLVVEGKERVPLVAGIAQWTQGELPNGIDDNANGLIDEPGLAFALPHAWQSTSGKTIQVFLTIEREFDGRMLSKTFSTKVTCSDASIR